MRQTLLGGPITGLVSADFQVPAPCGRILYFQL